MPVNIDLYRPQTKLREGNVFTPVCDPVHTGGVSVQGGLCSGVSVWGLYPGGSLSRGGSLSGRPPRTVKSGQYASYWNAFLYSSYF